MPLQNMQNETVRLSEYAERNWVQSWNKQNSDYYSVRKAEYIEYLSEFETKTKNMLGRQSGARMGLFGAKPV